MRAVEAPAAGEPFDLVGRPVPEPGPDEVRVAVDACGICYSDSSVREGTRPGVEYPQVGLGVGLGPREGPGGHPGVQRAPGVTPAVETYPLEAADEADERLRANEARFRVVLEP